MTEEKKENKKQEVSNEENKKQETKLQPIQLAYTLNTYVPSEKGIYMWLAPLGITWDDSLEYLDKAKEKTKELKAIALKKEEEKAKKAKEEEKPPASNVIKGDFKAVE